MLIRNGKINYQALRRMAERYTASCRAKANALCQEAGIGPYTCTTLHNALLDQGTRNGWGAQVTDWSKLRQAHWLTTNECWRGEQLLSDLYKRRGWQAFDWEAA